MLLYIGSSGRPAAFKRSWPDAVWLPPPLKLRRTRRSASSAKAGTAERVAASRGGTLAYPTDDDQLDSENEQPRRHLRRNLDGDRVGELGCRSSWRRLLAKDVFRFLNLPGRGDSLVTKGVVLGGASALLLFLLLWRHRKRGPILPRFLRAHVVPP